MASVNFPPSIGGDGSTVTDDRNPTTGLRNGGYLTRFVPALSNLVNVSNFVVNYVTSAIASISASVTTATTQANAASSSAASASSSASSASSSAASALQSFNGTVNYIISTEFAREYVNYATAIADARNRMSGQIVKVLSDETRSGVTAFYQVSTADAKPLSLDFTTGTFMTGVAQATLTFVREQDFSRVAVPATSTSPGNVGNIALDSGALYYCYAVNSWRKINSASF